MSIELMTQVWKNTPLRGTELLIMLCLADHANDDGVCWPSYKRISERSRTSPRWAMRCVKSLESQGYLTRERGNVGHSNTYHISIPSDKVVNSVHPPKDVKGVKPVVPSSPTPAVQFTPPLLFNDTGGVVPSSHESSVEPSENRHESAAKAASVSVEHVFEHILSVSTTNQVLAVALAERWINAHRGCTPKDWRADVTEWLKASA